MRQFSLFLFIVFFAIACQPSRPIAQGGYAQDRSSEDTLIVESLFADKSASISEENIQHVLDGNYRLPGRIRVAVVRLENTRQQRYYWNDENYLKTQQSYLDSLSDRLRTSPRVTAIATIPDILLPKSPSFTMIREAAVRMQCDMVLVYSISDDLYSRYKAFTTPDLKAFATTQLVLMDIRTGLIPFSTIVTKDAMTKKTKEDLDLSQARDRIRQESVLATLKDAGQQVVRFLSER